MRRPVSDRIHLDGVGQTSRFGPVDGLENPPTARARSRIDDQTCQRVAANRNRLRLLHAVEHAVARVADLRVAHELGVHRSGQHDQERKDRHRDQHFDEGESAQLHHHVSGFNCTSHLCAWPSTSRCRPSRLDRRWFWRPLDRWCRRSSPTCLLQGRRSP